MFAFEVVYCFEVVFFLEGDEFRFEVFEGLGLVLKLGAFVLALDCEAGWDVCDADGGVCCVD